MNYSVNQLSAVSECDSLLSMAVKEKESLTYRKTSLERQKASYAEKSVEIHAELQSVELEITALDTVLASLPEGHTKDDNLTKKKKLDLKQYLLTERSEDYGVVALIDREFDLARVEKELEETDALILAVQQRRDQIQASAA